MQRRQRLIGRCSRSEANTGQRLRSTLRAEEEQQLAAEFDRLRARGAVVTGELREGEAARQLVRVAADAAMLVVGSHGHGALGRALLGSVSTECARHATCPVVVIPAVAASRVAASDGADASDTDPATQR